MDDDAPQDISCSGGIKLNLGVKNHPPKDGDDNADA